MPQTNIRIPPDLLFFCGAEQRTTREARTEKHLDRILAGKGLDDR
jgi:uncharacterized protein YdeI (YjbR/CyaY-like superfamily)